MSNFSFRPGFSDTRPSSCAPSSLGVPDAAVGVGAGMFVSIHRASRFSGRGDGGLSASGSTSGSGPVDQSVWAERKLARRVVPPAGGVVVGHKVRRTSYSSSSEPTTAVAGSSRRHVSNESVAVRVGAQRGASAISSTPPEAIAIASGRRSRSDQTGRVALGEGLRGDRADGVGRSPALTLPPPALGKTPCGAGKRRRPGDERRCGTGASSTADGGACAGGQDQPSRKRAFGDSGSQQTAIFGAFLSGDPVRGAAGAAREPRLRAQGASGLRDTVVRNPKAQARGMAHVPKLEVLEHRFFRAPSFQTGRSDGIGGNGATQRLAGLASGISHRHTTSAGSTRSFAGNYVFGGTAFVISGGCSHSGCAWRRCIGRSCSDP